MLVQGEQREPRGTIFVWTCLRDRCEGTAAAKLQCGGVLVRSGRPQWLPGGLGSSLRKRLDPMSVVEDTHLASDDCRSIGRTTRSYSRPMISLTVRVLLATALTCTLAGPLRADDTLSIFDPSVGRRITPQQVQQRRDKGEK